MPVNLPLLLLNLLASNPEGQATPVPAAVSPGSDTQNASLMSSQTLWSAWALVVAAAFAAVTFIPVVPAEVKSAMVPMKMSDIRSTAIAVSSSVKPFRLLRVVGWRLDEGARVGMVGLSSKSRLSVPGAFAGITRVIRAG
jgi:hypothetical protein